MEFQREMNTWSVFSIFMLMLLMVSLSFTGAQAQWSSAVEEQLTDGTDYDWLTGKAIAVDNFGTLHVVFDRLEGWEHNHFYMQKPVGGEWSEPEEIGDHTQLQGGIFWLEVNPQTGEPYLVFFEDFTFYLAIRQNGVWNLNPLDIPDVISASNMSMAIDDMGRAHIAFKCHDDSTEYWRIAYGYWDGSPDFHFQIVPGTTLGEAGMFAGPDIAVRSDGSVAINYRNAWRFIMFRLEVAENHALGGDSWDIHWINEPSVACFPGSIVASENDDLHLAFISNLDTPWDDNLYYTMKPDGSTEWTDNVQINGAYQSIGPDMIVDSEGSLHIISHETNGLQSTGNILYSTNQNGFWEYSYVVEGDVYDPTWVMDSAGNGNLVYRREVIFQEDNDIYYYGFVAPPAPPPELDITLTPESIPVQIGPGGGTFDYALSIRNLGTTTAEFDAWIQVDLPGGSTFGPLILHELELAAGEMLDRQMTQDVPANAPGGSYNYRVKAGDYPGTVYASDEFEVIKAVPDGSTAYTSWDTDGFKERANTSDAQWDLLFSSEAGSTCGDDQILAAQFAGSHFYVSGANNGLDPNKVYMLNPDGSYFGEFDQWTPSGESWRDFAYDGQYIYGCSGNVIHAFDLTGNPVPSMDIPIPYQSVEAVAYDPLGDVFWIISTGEMFIFERGGTLISYVPTGYMFITGMAWDDVSPDGPWLWLFCQTANPPTVIRQFDPINWTLTGLAYTVPLLPGAASQTAGGLFFTSEWSDDVHCIGGIAQASPYDQLFLLEMYPQSSGPAAVDVELTYVSGSPVPVGGGNLVFDVWVENLESTPVDFDAWLDISYQGQDPVTVVQRSFVDYQPGWTINRPGMWYPIPAAYAAGDYRFSGKVGDHPAVVWDESGFPFVKSGISDGSAFTPFAVAGAPDPFDRIDRGEAAPESFIFAGNYPNPFNPLTTFTFQLPQAGHTTLQVFNLKGELIETLVHGMREAGSHDVTFDASRLASGVYLYRLHVGTYNADGKMVLIK